MTASYFRDWNREVVFTYVEERTIISDVEHSRDVLSNFMRRKLTILGNLTGNYRISGSSSRSGSNASLAARTPNLNLAFGSGNGGT